MYLTLIVNAKSVEIYLFLFNVWFIMILKAKHFCEVVLVMVSKEFNSIKAYNKKKILMLIKK